jgi:threonine/homoserine/homoserine lactone efflux protein
MLEQFFTIGILMLLSAMLPGPDFALVTKNTILHSRRAGLFTSLGVGSAILIHITYCALGLAIVISQSLLLFSLIKFIGAGYLVYLGLNSLISKKTPATISADKPAGTKTQISDFVAFRQGFLCNLALFTVIIKPETPALWEFIYAIEMFFILTAWFCSLTLILSHPKVLRGLNRVEKYISKVLGVFFIGFGVALAFVKQ